MKFLGIEVNLKNSPVLDQEFLPLYAWEQEYLKEEVQRKSGGRVRAVSIALGNGGFEGGNTGTEYDDSSLDSSAGNSAPEEFVNLFHLSTEMLCKMLSDMV